LGYPVSGPDASVGEADLPTDGHLTAHQTTAIDLQRDRIGVVLIQRRVIDGQGRSAAPVKRIENSLCLSLHRLMQTAWAEYQRKQAGCTSVLSLEGGRG
jgi:hypothetical protein